MVTVYNVATGLKVCRFERAELTDEEELEIFEYFLTEGIHVRVEFERL